jgi:hypothetical protein
MDNHDPESLDLENLSENSEMIVLKIPKNNNLLFFCESIVKICTVITLFILCFIIVIVFFHLIDTCCKKHYCDSKVYSVASYHDYKSLSNNLNNTLTLHGYNNSEITCSNKICYVISFKDEYKLIIIFYVTYNKYSFLPFVKDPKMCILNDANLLS